MSKRRKRGLVLYVFWIIGIMLIPILARSQSLFPNVSGDHDIREWVFMFLVGAGFSIWLFLYKKALERKEQQRDNQNKVFANMEKSMLIVTERLKDMDRSQCKQQKQLNRHFQYIMEHNNCHLEHGLPTNQYHFEHE